MPKTKASKNMQVQTVRFPEEMKEKVQNAAAKRNVEPSEIIRDAVDKYFDDESYWDIVFRRMTRQRNHIMSLEKQIKVLTEGFLKFTQYFFALTPQVIADDDPQAMMKISQERYNKYLAALKEELSRGGLLRNLAEELATQKQQEDEEQTA